MVRMTGIIKPTCCCWSIVL